MNGRFGLLLVACSRRFGVMNRASTNVDPGASESPRDWEHKNGDKPAMAEIAGGDDRRMMNSLNEQTPPPDSPRETIPGLGY